MATNPQDIAEENAQRSALAAQGEPTEFAQDPALSTQLAGGGTSAVLEVINKLRKVPTEKPDLPKAPTTPQESVLLPDDGTYSADAARRQIAPEVLSPEGLTEFERRNFQATPNENVEVLRSAEDAIAEAEAEAAKASVDKVKADARNALNANQQGFGPEAGVVSEAQADQALDLIETKAAGIKTLADGGDFNFDYMDTGDDINAAITALSEVYKDPTTAAKRGYISNQTTIQNAAERLQDEIGMTRSILKRGEGSTWSAEEFVAARELLARSAEKLTALANKIHTGQASDLERLAFRRQMAIHAGIQMQLKGAQTEAARALQSFQIKVGGEQSAVRQAQEAKRMLTEAGGIELTDDMAERFLAIANNPAVSSSERVAGINAMARGGWKAKTRQILSEAYLAGLLSNPSTQIKNIVGTAGFMLYQLPAEFAAGVYGSIGRKKNKFLYPTVPLNPDQVYVNDALMRFKGFMDSFQDALRVGAIGFKTELPAGASKLDVETYRAAVGQSDSVFSKALDQYGKRARLPFQLLLFADEFFKTMSQRGELYVQANHAYKNAINNGKTVQEAQDEAAMLLLDPYSKSDTLIDKSKYDTLQSDLGKLQKVTGTVQNFDIAGLPVGRFILPFATAPTNDMIRSAEFVPFLNLVVPGQASAAIKVGTREHQMMMGRLAVGGITMGVVANYALQGHFTGAMPKDPSAREMLPEGWQPWSFAFKADPENWPKDDNGEPLPLYNMYGKPNGKLKFVSYNGYGPVSTLLGITADTVQRMNMAPDPRMRQGFAGAAVSATASYYSDLPMLEGIANLQSVFDMQTGNLEIDLTKILKSPAQVATPIGLPNPLSSAQDAVTRTFVGSGSTRPREDVQYWTEADILQTDEDGNYIHVDALGDPDYSKIGMIKNGDDVVLRFIKELDAYQSRNSLFKSDEDKNAPSFDTLGNQLGAADRNIFVSPFAAVSSNLLGVKISETEDAPIYVEELLRIATLTGGWPLTNPKSSPGDADEKLYSVRLSPGVQSDWINFVKNPKNPDQFKLYMPGLAEVTFQEALEDVLVSTSNRYGREYDRADDEGKRQLIIDLHNRFMKAGWAKMLKDPKYENIAIAIDDLNNAKIEGNIP